MPFLLNTHSAVLITMFLASRLVAPSSLVTAYVISSQNLPTAFGQHRPQQQPTAFRSAALPSAAGTPNFPTSSLASKVIFQSPAMENIYKEFLVASKPLNLRKYGSAAKIKKPKKESKIYYISIPPMPYRFIPGVGYDYQPMRINPILQETTTKTPKMEEVLVPVELHGIDDVKSPQQSLQQSNVSPQHQPNNITLVGINSNNNKKPQEVMNVASLAANSSSSLSESRLIRLNRGDYFFNGRPFRLRVAHAQPKQHLTAQNLKSKFYFNKNIIY